MRSWNHSLIEEIFAKKQKEKSEDRDNLLILTSRRLYGEKIHYALELIQNAEDEDSPSITFIFCDDNVSVINDGEVFDEKDVWRICSVRPGEKKKKIGFFGIGFKSVFNITEKPQIISGEFNFEIGNLIYPKAKSSIPKNVEDYYSANRGAIFVLPYGSLSTPKELIDNFNLIDDKILLFLESLKELRFIDNINNNLWALKKNLRDDSVVSLSDMRTKRETEWKVFHRVLRVEDKEIIPDGKEGIEETRITIAFPLDSAIRDEITKTGVAYCFLPTKKRTDLPFLIQADFLPTIGRENISDHSWNIWLMKKLGILAAESINTTKNDEQFYSSLYDFIPLSEEIQDVLVRHLFESFFESLKEKQIAKTTKGWTKPTECVIPKDEKIRELLSESDLKLLLGDEVYYVEPRASERAKSILLEFGAKSVGSKDVVNFLKRENEIKKKSKEWFLNLYEYLSTVFDTNFRWNWNEETRILFGELEKTRFILTEDNNFVPLKDSSTTDRLVCYPHPIDISEVLQLFTEGEIVFLNRYFQESSITRRKKGSAEIEEKRKRIKDWFDSIGVKKYFKQSHIIRFVILPKFSTGKYKKYSDLKLYGLVDYVRRYWPTIESEIKNKKLRADTTKEIRSSLLLKTFSFEDGKKIDGYKSPEEIYFSKRYGKNEIMEDLFEGIDDIHFLSSYYLNREKRERLKKKRKKRVKHTWRKFFELLGVWSSPRVVKEEEWISISGKKGYDWLEKEYSPSGIHEIYGNSYSKDLEKLIGYCSKMDDQSSLQRRMQLLWQSLGRNWKIYREKQCKVMYKWFYRTENCKDYEDSSFLEFLRNAQWVPGNDGCFYKPKDTFTDTKLNHLLLGDDVKYVSLKADESFLRDLKVRIQPEIEEVIRHLKAYKEKNPNPTENKTEKMNTLYIFLKDKINGIKESENKESKIREVHEIFNKNELIYLPREDKAWWKPIHVFWRDYSNVFETLRGYAEHQGAEIYNIALREFFFSIGVIETPTVKECLDVLEQIKENINLYGEVISRIYPYLNDIAKRGLTKETDWNRKVFLSEKGHYLKPSELYYSDNDDYKKYFGDVVEILRLPFSWSNVNEFLHNAGFRRLGQNIIVTKKFGDVDEIEGDATNQLIERLAYVENYLKNRNVEMHKDLQKEGVFKKVKDLQAFETSRIVLDYAFKRDNPEPIVVNNIERNAYFSVEENRIYKSSQTTLFSTSVAKELSRLFASGEDYVFPFLDSLFSASSDEELNEKLKHFGIQIEISLVEVPYESVKILPSKEGVDQKLKPERELKKPKKLGKKTAEKPQLPESGLAAKRSDLLNPDEFIFDTVEERTPYLRTEGAPTVPMKMTKLKKAHPGAGPIGYTPRKRVSRIDAEAIALEIAMRFEETEDREPEDRHTQRSIGYDLYSRTKDERERFIEVKHFRGNPGIFDLTPHQWKKAEIEKDKYFVYIISGLREGGDPKLEMVQNPVKYITPDPPMRKKFRNWENGVIKIVRFRKV